jgi:chromosome segregation protein
MGEQGEKVIQAAAVLEELRGKLEDFDQNRRELQESQRDQSAKVRELRASLEQVSQSLHHGELQCVEIEATLREERRKLEGVDLESLTDEQAEPEVLAKLERKILSLEPLNLAAEAEYKVAEERLTFLQEQLKDLDQAEADLQQTVTALNKEARERFESGFERIRANLQKIFLSIFEGGSADIRLTGDDPLESRIELLAAPPGKRIGSLTLLSGGEKALTAISLLFAIYLEKPSPFCILDEVDAPLDDENTGRFCRMLKSFTGKTQFLVITHNKRTMTEAEQLLGITMEEEGISKVVPVKLN